MEYQFGEKHIAYMQRARESVMNVAEGAVRAGKTVDNLFVFAALLEISPDRLHLATGSTGANAKLNLGDCNGFGLEWMFSNRCRWGRYKGSDALMILTATGEKTVLFAGGKNADSYKRIRGLSIGMWIATEINLHHPSMIREAFSRQLAAKDRRIFWDLNPEPPHAPIYRDFLDGYAKKAADGTLPAQFYNYCHFTIFDNATIPAARMTEILAQYERDSLWYRRDILGERCAAEGSIYTQFVSNPDWFIVKPAQIPRCAFLTVGVDFGGNRSKTAFVACGFTPGFSRLFAVAEDKVAGCAGQIDADTVNGACLRFLEKLRRLFPDVPVRYIFCDSEEQYLIAGMRRFLKRRGVAASVQNARKLPVHERIACETSLMASGRLFLSADCADLAAGFEGAMWDRGHEKLVRLDDFTSDVDILDAFEYAFERYIHKLT